MTIKYEIYQNSQGTDYVKATLADGRELFIPNDPANSDYQAYLDRDKPKAALSTPIVSSDG